MKNFKESWYYAVAIVLTSGIKTEKGAKEILNKIKKNGNKRKR